MIVNPSALKNLVAGIVDYAGLFPPAQLDMQTVVENYGRYCGLNTNWMLARLIVPATRLDEFEEASRELLPTAGSGWRLSVLLPPFSSDQAGFKVGIERIAAFNHQHRDSSHGLASVDVIETRLPEVGDLSGLYDMVPDELSAFLELPLDDELESHMARICEMSDPFGRNRLFAKIRTGGVKQKLIPVVEDVARFIYWCGQFLLPFKATAGLHHPWHGQYRLTYEDNAELGTMYGYLNVFAAACFSFSGMVDQDTLQAVLIDENSELRFTDDEVVFRDLSVGRQRVEQIRRKLAFSFGSCSFDEPTCELNAEELLHQ